MKRLLNKMAAFLFMTSTLMVAVSCEDFLDVNNDPNNPTEVPVENILPAIQARLATFVAGPENVTGALLSQQLAASYSQYRGADQYNFNSTSFTGQWQSLYSRGGQDISTFINLSQEAGNINYEAMGITMEVYMMQMVTDLWGDAPYSQAFNAAFDFPEYDTQEQIYATLVNRIDQAIAMFDNSVATSAIAGFDLMYGGDVDSWRKFANAVKLRVMMRKSDVDEAGSRTAVMAMSAANLIASNAESAKVDFGTTTGNQNPFYDIHQNSSRTGDLAISDTHFNLLSARNDPRMDHYFQPDAANGFTTVQPTTNGQNSLYPAGYSVVSAYFIDIDLGASSVTNANADVAPGYFISYAEVAFLMAEAAERWGSFGGNAKTHYDAAVTAAFDMHEVTGVAAYLTEPNVDFSQVSNRLEAIHTQKYLGSFTQGLEAWIHWRRTDVPTLSGAMNNVINATQPPVRLMYSQSELDRNGGNVPGKYGSSRETELNARVWWDVN